MVKVNKAQYDELRKSGWLIDNPFKRNYAVANRKSKSKKKTYYIQSDVWDDYNSNKNTSERMII